LPSATRYVTDYGPPVLAPDPYPVPVHRQPAYDGCLTCGPSGLGVTERAAPQILSLPMYPQLSDEAVDRVIAEIRAFFA